MDFRKKINGMARNYLENAADMIRQEGITIYSIGLNGIAGQISRLSREWDEYGYEICQRVANVPEARRGYFNPSQPQGLFVWAMSGDDIFTAFSTVVTAIFHSLALPPRFCPYLERGKECFADDECPGQACIFLIGTCGADGQAGRCAYRTSGCPRVWDPVCGCDGSTYGNCCDAARQGVSVLYRGRCQ